MNIEKNILIIYLEKKKKLSSHKKPLKEGYSVGINKDQYSVAINFTILSSNLKKFEKQKILDQNKLKFISK